MSSQNTDANVEEGDDFKSLTVVDEAEADQDINLYLDDGDGTSTDFQIVDSDHDEPNAAESQSCKDNTETAEEHETIINENEEVLNETGTKENTAEPALISAEQILEDYVTVKEEEESKLNDSEKKKEDQPEAETHPYLYLIETFEFPSDQMKLTTVGACKSLEETTCTVVYSKNALLIMLQALRNVKEISLEVHTAESEYEPSICIISLSTKDADYLLDAVKLKNQLLLLTEIFINPKIVKIVYGAKRVLAALQGKLHLYLVNIFDAEKAKHLVLELPERNWALQNVIIKEYKFDRGKLTKPDWKIRPIPENYLNFLRGNAHYLIYIYHDFKNRLILKDPDQYQVFLDFCRNACKMVNTDRRTEQLEAFVADLKLHHNCQLDILKKLFNWRNKVAEKHNVQPDIVLSKYALLAIVRNLTIDEEVIQKCTNSFYVKKDMEEIKTLIYQSKVSFKIGKRIRNKKSQAEQKAKEGLKRKAGDEVPQNPKQMRIETSKNNQNSPIKKSPIEHNNKPVKYFYRRKNKNKKPNGPPQLNKNDNFRPKISQLTNKNESRKYTRFEPVQSFNMNPNSVFLTPTNIPSALTFQGNSSSGSSRDSSLQHLVGRAVNEAREILNSSLTNLNLVENEMRRTGRNFSDNYGSNRYRDLSDIDERIDSLDRQYALNQSRNNRDNSQYRRRY